MTASLSSTIEAKFEKIVNLSNYSDDDVLEIAEGLAGKHNTSDYGVFENQYKFIELKYYESGFNIKEYYTVVNGYNYTFTFQSNFSMGYEEYNEFDDIKDLSYKPNPVKCSIIFTLDIFLIIL